MLKSLGLLILALIFMVSCKDDNQATLEVINQTGCMHNIYDGLNSGGEFLGVVGANQTSKLTIELGSVETIFNSSFAADPVNCSLNLFEQQFQADVRAGETTTILVD